MLSRCQRLSLYKSKNKTSSDSNGHGGFQHAKELLESNVVGLAFLEASANKTSYYQHGNPQ
jgi:hypothetical protein